MEAYLHDIEQELQKIVPHKIEPSFIHSHIGSSFTDKEYPLVEAIISPARDLLYRGGKRWRPLLMLLVAHMVGGKESYDKALPLTPLVELPHNGSLIIDDIEDNSDLRRGEKAIHTIYGTDISINAGNFLYYYPTLLIDNSSFSSEKKLSLYQIYARNMRNIHLGQGMDITWHNNQRMIPTTSAYELMCKMKTGCLAAMGSELGCAVASDDQKLITSCGHLGEDIGLLFQMIDDILNLESGNPGKHQGDDIVENKKSLPIIMYIEQFPNQQEEVFELFAYAKKHGYEKSQSKILLFLEKINDSGVLQQARFDALKMHKELIARIHSLFDESKEREHILNLMDFIVSQ
ncbi:MAG: polyprenyl synthetase family protein [Sphaerochaetaceae bacterium]|jgi:geranylgeranyl pyrophosphate synthase